MTQCLINSLYWHKDLESYYNQDPDLFLNIAEMVAYECLLKWDGKVRDSDEFEDDIRKWYKAIQ